MTDTNALLAERETTHGSFTDNARVAQTLRAMFRAQDGWDKMSDIEREALDMIAGKLSRILSGRAGFADHWADLAGYATLVLDQIKQPG